MISTDLARSLRAAGLPWEPASGDRFTILQPELAEEVFVLSDMTVEVHRFPTGPVIGFNGTTEWALDSVSQEEALWLPHEHQLRERLGVSFLRLERTPSGADSPRWRVVAWVDGAEEAFEDDDVEEAYGRALLQLAAVHELSA
jgi:hypothetical protein